MEKKQAFIQMRAKELSYDAISIELNISKPTLIKWSDELKNEIGNIKTIERESLREHLLITKKHRLTILSLELEKVKIELSKRDYSDISTEKLICLLEKLNSCIKEEDDELKFTVFDQGVADFTIGSTREWFV